MMAVKGEAWPCARSSQLSLTQPSILVDSPAGSGPNTSIGFDF